MSQLQKFFKVLGTDITEEEKEQLTQFCGGKDHMISDDLIEEVKKAKEDGGLDKVLKKYALSFNQEVIQAHEMVSFIESKIQEVRNWEREHGRSGSPAIHKVVSIETELLKVKIRIREIENFQRGMIKFLFARNGCEIR